MRIVIIGNGIAGVTAAETVRAQDKNSDIVIFSDEKYPLYSRPRLIEFLADKATVEQITIHAQSWYEKNNIQLKLSSRVTGIDAESKKVKDNAGKEFSYDKLVIATGASSLVPPIPGIDAPEIVALRTIDDAEKIKALASNRKNAAVIGGGLLGIEAANSLSLLGCRVQVLEISDRLLPRQLDSESSGIIQKLLEKKGLRFLIGTKIRSIQRKNGGYSIICSDGKETVADFIVISAGIRPNIPVIDGTSINRNRGIVVDDCMRTSVPDIYACGDVSEFGGCMYGLWQPAREQGAVCGGHIAGAENVFTGTVLSARLKVAGIELASLGNIEKGEGVTEHVERNESAGAVVYKKLFVKDRKLVGAVLIGNVKEAAKLQRMIKGGEEVSL